MPRLIDANALKRAIRMESWKQETQIQLALDYIDIIIDEQTKVDAVEVVRCKDCKYYYYSAYAMRCVCDFDNKEWDKDDFCSYGERREGE